MTYRSILIELREDEGNGARTEAALALAERFGAELVGLHIAPLPVLPVSYGEGAAYLGPELIEVQHEASQAIQGRVRAAFEAACARSPVPWRGLYVEDVAGSAFAQAARTADLSLVAPPPASGLEAIGTENADDFVVGAGGPVLVLPQGAGATLPPRRALVAWNGSKGAARALKDAIPLLRHAEEVVVLALRTEGEPGSEAAAVQLLERHEVKARPLRREPEGGTGQQLLGLAAELGAELLVMGAYGHSRLREMVFGGATREALRQAPLPLLLSA